MGFAEVGDEVRALGFFRQWKVCYDEAVAMPLDPQGHWLLNNLNAGSLPNGYVLMEDSLEQHRRLCLMTEQGMEPICADTLLDEMMPNHKLFFDPVAGEVLLPLAVWAATRWYEKRRNRRRMIMLQREKMQREELIDAIRKKVIEEVKTSNLAKDIVKMTEKSFDQRLTLRTASGTIMVDVKDIVYFKGEGNYSQIVTFHDKNMVLLGLGTLEEMLSPDVFVRADRSTLVNVHHIYTLLPKQHRCVFRSPSGQEIETMLLTPAFKRLQDLL